MFDVIFGKVCNFLYYRFMNKKHILLIIFSLILAGCAPPAADLNLSINNQINAPVTENVNAGVNQNTNQDLNANSNDNTPLVEIPVAKPTVNETKKMNLDVPFATQAPYSVWDDLHNEACEEASMIIAYYYFNNKRLNPDLMEQEILSLISWEEKNGYVVDVTAQETADILSAKFNLTAKLIYTVTVEAIKAELLKGNLVIIPVAGRMLSNPNFKRPGPLYHMLVIRGFDEDEFITNDPGTRKGENYRYKYKTIINAIHDWPKSGFTKEHVTEDEMNQGQKVFISVSK